MPQLYSVSFRVGDPAEAAILAILGSLIDVAVSGSQLRQPRIAIRDPEVDNELVIPADTRVRFLVTAEDVIHSWWVPDLGVKKDAIPGFINETWTKVPASATGTYRGQCTELCGKDHGFMPVVVKVVSKADYKLWLAQKEAERLTKIEKEKAEATKNRSLAELMADGEKVYMAKCSACHQKNGEGIPGGFPALKGSAIATGPVADHIDIVINGKVGSAMAAYRNQLSPAELAAVITFERNAWGNDTGDQVQTRDIIAAKSGNK